MRSSAKSAPRPVAASRPSEPPSPTGFPVITAGRIATRPRVLVVHPRHLARTGVDVGGGDVAVRADHHLDRREVGAAEPLELADREGLRVDLHASLGAAERDVEECRLPRHQRREAAELVARCVLVETESSLERTSARRCVGSATRDTRRTSRRPGRPGPRRPPRAGGSRGPSGRRRPNRSGRPLDRGDPGPPRTDRRTRRPDRQRARRCTVIRIESGTRRPCARTRLDPT